MNKQYSAKLLLLGEHTVVLGSRALAMPFDEFAGEWKWVDTNPQSADSLRNMLLYMIDLEKRGELLGVFDLKQFEKDLKSGLWFDSSIPTGYGLGSSGALCAAVYDSYGINKESNFARLKAILGQLESCFHGQSSGTDPLICYTHQALMLDGLGGAKQVTVPRLVPENGAIFLVDTGVARKTTPLVNYFVAQSKLADFREHCLTPLSKVTNQAIDSLLDGNWEDLWGQVDSISAIQLAHLQRLILEDSKAIWEQGLTDELYRLKLCGAGGGGLLLGFAKDWEKTQAILKEYSLKRVL